MGTFGMQMDEVFQAGKNISGLAEEWLTAKQEIEKTVEMISEAYPSSDGIELAEQIKSYTPMLNRMQEKLALHGATGMSFANTTAATNEEIRTQIKI